MFHSSSWKFVDALTQPMPPATFLHQ
jgi:hypothetical protein